MKKLIVSLILIPNLVFGAVEYDLVKGIDLTLTNFVTSSALNQLVDAGTISTTNKGGIIRRSGGSGSWWPDVTSNPRYTNFIWLDMITSPPQLKTYVCCGDVNSNWVVGAVTAGSIGTAQIADYSITSSKMATNSVPSYAYIAGSISGNAIADNGIIAGKLGPSVVSNANYAPSSITGDKIAVNTISNNNIYPNTIRSNEIANATINNTQIGDASIIASNKLVLQSINGTNIVNGGIASVQIANGTITSNNIANTTINIVNLGTNVVPGLAKAWGIFNSAGVMQKGYNLVGGAQLNTGDYSVHFTNGFAPTSTNYIAVGNPLQASDYAISFYSNTVNFIGLKISDGSSVDQNAPFMVLFFDFP